MSKSGRNRHKGNGSGGKNGAGSQVPGSVSLSTFRVGRALDALTPAFVQWFDDGSPGAAALALGCLKQVENVLGRYMDSTAAAEVTGFEPVPLAAAISDEVVALSDAPADGMTDLENAGFIVGAFHVYVDFLAETGQWSGSAEQLAGVVDFLDLIADDDDEPGVIDVPYIPEEEALKALSELPLIRRATALLRWIGDGRPVTATGALRLRDIEAAAACVGVAVKGGAKQTSAPLPGTAVSSEPVPTVRSMYEVPLLAQMWNALEAAELIQIKSTKAVPFPDSAAFLTGSDSERLDEFSLFALCFLREAVLGFDPEQPWERILAGIQTSILIAATTADPPSMERVLAAPHHAPAAEKSMTELLTSMAVGRLEGLSELGLLTIDTHFRVPAALIGCVADVFDDDRLLAELGLEEDPDDSDDDKFLRWGGPETAVPETAVPLTAVTAAPQVGAPVLQLKITLNDSRPPIWRRVLVPAGMPLPQLHQVIQSLFGWFDYHLHEFRTGGFRGPAYAPLNDEGEFYGDASLDESSVTVGDLLPAVGSTLTYTYDFGDNWVHGIKLEKVLTSDDDGGQLPRCTAGRGAAPAEDSGGTRGWANIVQAVNDPGHEDNREYREWLGMVPGEILDPRAFDIDELNENLADLF
ncbi:plasmid pRiA4b ORF-3 family protein [Arthrobacter sp. TE12232]